MANDRNQRRDNRSRDTGEAGRTPTHDVVYKRIAYKGQEQVELYQEIAPAWESRNGHVSFTLSAVPAELLAGQPVFFVVRKRDAR